MPFFVLAVVNKQAWVESSASHALELLQRLFESQNFGHHLQ